MASSSTSSTQQKSASLPIPHHGWLLSPLFSLRFLLLRSTTLSVLLPQCKSKSLWLETAISSLGPHQWTPTKLTSFRDFHKHVLHLVGLPFLRCSFAFWLGVNDVPLLQTLSPAGFLKEVNRGRQHRNLKESVQSSSERSQNLTPSGISRENK